ncbi:uncharacterized protein LOC110445996 isoform X1 [Mizuhopecten yessoensis]|uniref:uncharacterized protein LOC110445996 isoform X1 n=1 Tax=Mizuhopecten yessoensis TaxID=6573 RepID=UPI000B45B819|nr:uncharacterized protein LOC110445996 isoform X1 [Mizuhopecten yessoensis]
MSSQQASPGVKLPPINESSLRGPHRLGGAAGISADGVGTVPVSVTIPGGGRGTQVNVRSVPAYTDVLQSNMPGRQGRPSHIYSSSIDYNNKPRQVSKPSVVAFDGFEVPRGKSRRKVNGFFPPVKLRKGGKGNGHENGEQPYGKKKPFFWKPPQKSEQMVPVSDTSHYPMVGKIHLTPTAHTEIRSKSVMSRNVGYFTNARMSPDSIRTAQTAPEGIVYPNIINETDYDDITVLPPPKKILPRREVPWVFRYKVKRNMNELAKILASKAPQPVVDQAS